MSVWFQFSTRAGDAPWNMAVDELLLQHAAETGAPVLRFYSWKDPRAATFGYFQKYAEVSSWTSLRPLIRRPTAGGLVPHDKDWTYSVIIPPGHEWFEIRAEESYKRLHQWLRLAFKQAAQIQTELAPVPQKELPGQCFAGPDKFDLLWRGRKIAGAAQRRNKFGLLIQGSVQEQPPNVRREQWESGMIEAARSMFEVEWKSFVPPAAFSAEARQLAEDKYARDSHNQRR